MGKKTTHKRTDPHTRAKRTQEVEQIYQELRAFAQSAWGQAWIDSVLEFGRPYRMQRGVRYAQEDRVENLTVSPGTIFATVQGTAPTPYRVKVQFGTITEEGWKKIIELMAEKAIYLIQLLENKMPEAFMGIFEEAGYPLFPPPAKELTADCSCPDQEIPCKHIAATVLYIARVLDFDPFVLLKLRGKPKEDILRELRQAQSCENRPIVQAVKKIREQTNAAEFTFEDIPNITCQDLFLSQFLIGDPIKIGFRFKQPGGSIETLDTLGVPPNITVPEQFGAILREIYLAATKTSYNLASELERMKTKGEDEK